MSDTPILPPLPEPEGVIVVNTQALRAFTADQMLSHREEYAKPLVDELEAVLDWARTEKAPLRKQEIESIRRVLSLYDKKD